MKKARSERELEGEAGRERKEMLRTYGRGEGNVDAFLPDSLPKRALRGISMLYNWHESGFLLSQQLLTDLWAMS